MHANISLIFFLQHPEGGQSVKGRNIINGEWDTDEGGVQVKRGGGMEGREGQVLLAGL